jgi:phage/plasmid-associated DNA primase
MCYVGPLTKVVPRRHFDRQLEKEAPDFLAELLKLELPESEDRLGLPALTTSSKSSLGKMNQEPIEAFIYEMCILQDGRWIKFSDFYDALIQWLRENGYELMSKPKVGKELPPHIPKGRNHKTGQFYIGNICFRDTEYTEETFKKLGLTTEGYLEEIYNV